MNNKFYRECFLSYPLTVMGLDRHEPSTYHATPGTGFKRMRVMLPANLTCSQCILQYTYTSGNNWGKGAQSAEVATQDCIEEKEGKLGCGSQETFRGCADICIGEFCPSDQETCLTADMVNMSNITTTTTHHHHHHYYY